MLAIDIQSGLSEAWERIATFVPKFLGFLAILLIGYIIAKLLAGLVDRLLERVGFDSWVERGALKTALERSRFDASDILSVVTFWAIFLIALQLAFGVFGPNPVSDLITAAPGLCMIARSSLVSSPALSRIASGIPTFPMSCSGLVS